MVSSGPHWEGEREREEQVHPKLYNTHSSNQRIPEGGVWKVVMGRGWKGHSESPLLLTPKHDPSPTEPKTQTDLESVQKKKKKKSRHGDRDEIEARAAGLKIRPVHLPSRTFHLIPKRQFLQS